MAKKKPKSIQYWKQQIARGQAYQEKYGNSGDWDTWDRSYAKGSADGSSSFRTESYNMNFMFAQFRSLIPQVYFRNPRSSVIARLPGMTPHSKVLQTILDWLIGEMGTKTQLKRAMLDTLLYGTGFLKIGYDSQYGVDPGLLVSEKFEVEGIEEDVIEVELSGESLTQRDPDTFELIEYDNNIASGRPWAIRVHPRDIIVDPSCVDPMLDDAEWVVHRIMRKLSDIQADEKYDSNVTKKLQPSRSENYEKQDRPRLYDESDTAGEFIAADGTAIQTKNGFRGEPDNNNTIDEWVELWEIHDRKTQRVMVLNLDLDEWVRDVPDSSQIDGLPFIPIIFNTNPKSFWGISDAQVLHPQQNELNDTRRMQRQYRRSNTKRFITKPGAFSADQKSQILSDKMDVVLEISGESQSIHDAVIQIQGNMPPDLELWTGSVKNDMQDLLGVGQNQMGKFDNKTHRSATEASIVQSNSQIRVDERRDVLADALQRILRRISQMIWAWWEMPQVVRVAGPAGQQFWVQYTGGELRGEYDFDIQPDDATPLTNRQRLQDVTQLLQSVGQVIPPEMAFKLASSAIKLTDGVDDDDILQAQQVQTNPMSVGQFGEELQGAAVQAQQQAAAQPQGEQSA